jgi:hypothetical protein
MSDDENKEDGYATMKRELVHVAWRLTALSR